MVISISKLMRIVMSMNQIYSSYCKLITGHRLIVTQLTHGHLFIILPFASPPKTATILMLLLSNLVTHHHPYPLVSTITSPAPPYPPSIDPSHRAPATPAELERSPAGDLTFPNNRFSVDPSLHA